jgi:hypothetical protein
MPRAIPLLGRSGVLGVDLAATAPPRPRPLEPLPRLLAAVATGRRLGVAALERRVVVLRAGVLLRDVAVRLVRLLRLLALLLAGRALLATGVAVTGLAALAAAGLGAAALLLAGVAGLGVEPAGVLELAMALRKGREAVELNRAGRSVSHRAPRNR